MYTYIHNMLASWAPSGLARRRGRAAGRTPGRIADEATPERILTIGFYTRPFKRPAEGCFEKC